MSRLNGKVAFVITVLLPELGLPERLGVNALKPRVVEANDTPVGLIAEPGDIAAAAASLLPVLRYQPEVNASPAGAIAGPLSGRECDILHLIAQGCVNKEISRTLSISPETVKSHVKNIFIKLNVRKRAQAVWRARSLGLIGTT